MAHYIKKQMNALKDDGWSTVTTVADNAAKAAARRERRKKFEDYCKNHWPETRNAFARAAEAKFCKFQPREKPVGEDEVYDAEYTKTVAAAVKKACEKHMDCGKPVGFCRCTRCDRNRRACYDEWLLHAEDTAFVDGEVTYVDDDQDVKLPEPGAAVEAPKETVAPAKKANKGKGGKKQDDKAKPSGFAANPFALLAGDTTSESEGDEESDDELPAPSTPQSQVRTGQPKTPDAPRKKGVKGE